MCGVWYRHYLSSSEVDLSGCSTGDVIRAVWKRSWVREQPTDIRWMLGNAVCYSRHAAGGKWTWVRGSVEQTHTHTFTKECDARTLESLMGYSVIVYCHPFTKRTTMGITNTGGDMREWEGDIILLCIITPLCCSPVSLCESTWDHNPKHTHTHTQIRL